MASKCVLTPYFSLLYTIGDVHRFKPGLFDDYVLKKLGRSNVDFFRRLGLDQDLIDEILSGFPNDAKKGNTALLER